MLWRYIPCLIKHYALKTYGGWKHRYPAFNCNKMKHYISEMKADIKLCTSSFSVVTLPVTFLLSQDHHLSCIEEERPTSTGCVSWWSNISCMWNSRQANLTCLAKWKTSYVTEYEHDSPKANVHYTLVKNKVKSHFFFEEPMMTLLWLWCRTLNDFCRILTMVC
jgi:hypothetical protein